MQYYGGIIIFHSKMTADEYAYAERHPGKLTINESSNP